MQTVDSKEEVLRGVEILRTMAACNTRLGLSVDCGRGVGKLQAVPNSSSKADEGCVRQAPPVQLELLPLRPTSHWANMASSSAVVPLAAAPPFLWQPQASGHGSQASRGIDVNQIPSNTEGEDVPEASPDSVISSFQPESIRTIENGFGMKRERDKAFELDQERERTCEVSSRASDEEDGGTTRKKLRLSKEQSALLEESFKEHSTLNPKQKNALAKQLNLRPRQVEVWFQNRRARTKLKQTEVDCEVLKRWCESLTEENRRLQKELQELRAIKVAPPCVIAHDLYMPLPAATLTLCPSCERFSTMDNRTLGFAKQQMPQQFSQPSAAC